jgi:hypothetical protein
LGLLKRFGFGSKFEFESKKAQSQRLISLAFIFSYATTEPLTFLGKNDKLIFGSYPFWRIRESRLMFFLF